MGGTCWIHLSWNRTPLSYSLFRTSVQSLAVGSSISRRSSNQSLRWWMIFFCEPWSTRSKIWKYDSFVLSVGFSVDGQIFVNTKHSFFDQIVPGSKWNCQWVMRHHLSKIRKYECFVFSSWYFDQQFEIRKFRIISEIWFCRLDTVQNSKESYFCQFSTGQHVNLSVIIRLMWLTWRCHSGWLFLGRCD